MRSLTLPLILIAIVSLPISSVWALAPTQGALFSGSVVYSPNPPVAGQIDQFVSTFENLGSVAIKVTRLNLITDWGSIYYFANVPQIVTPGSNYHFPPTQVEIPIYIIGPHFFNQSVWIETPTSSGRWTSESERSLANYTIDIANVVATASVVQLTGGGFTTTTLASGGCTIYTGTVYCYTQMGTSLTNTESIASTSSCGPGCTIVGGSNAITEVTGAYPSTEQSTATIIQLAIIILVVATIAFAVAYSVHKRPTSKPQVKISCPNCGATPPTNSDFCNKCGTKLTGRLSDSDDETRAW